MPLDISAAFETADHDVLTDWLDNLADLNAPDCFMSYLSASTFLESVRLHNYPLQFLPVAFLKGLSWCVEILGHLMFSIYMLLLGEVISKSNIFYFYADVT